MQDEKVRLNLGGGDISVPGYVTVDRKTGGEAFPVRVSRQQSIDLGWLPDAPNGAVDYRIAADGSVDEIRASHVLEHFGHREVPKVLREWVRVLKPGGVLKVAVPDMDKIVDAAGRGNPDNWPIQSYLYGGQTDENDFHRAGFNEEYLGHLLTQLGLVDVRPWKSEIADCASLPVSLNLMATKPATPAGAAPPKLPKVTAVMSMPRLAFSDNMFSMLQVATRRGIEFTKVTGAFWNQCLTRGIEPLLDDGTEWVLVVDYDTVVTVREFDQLARLMLDHPEADAIAPMQVKRDEDCLLMGLLDDDGKPYAPGTPITLGHFDRPLVRASWAHFGFTFLRVSALRRLSRPWFHETPDPSGSWGEGRVDSDIQFWRNWQAAGNTLYLASRVSIGHAQMMCTYPGQDLKPVHVYMNDINKPGALSAVRR